MIYGIESTLGFFNSYDIHTDRVVHKEDSSVDVTLTYNDGIILSSTGNPPPGLPSHPPFTPLPAAKQLITWCSGFLAIISTSSSVSEYRGVSEKPNRIFKHIDGSIFFVDSFSCLWRYTNNKLSYVYRVSDIYQGVEIIAVTSTSSSSSRRLTSNNDYSMQIFRSNDFIFVIQLGVLTQKYSINLSSSERSRLTTSSNGTTFISLLIISRSRTIFLLTADLLSLHPIFTFPANEHPSRLECFTKDFTIATNLMATIAIFTKTDLLTTITLRDNRYVTAIDCDYSANTFAYIDDFMLVTEVSLSTEPTGAAAAVTSFTAQLSLKGTTSMNNLYEDHSLRFKLDISHSLVFALSTVSRHFEIFPYKRSSLTALTVGGLIPPGQYFTTTFTDSFILVGGGGSQINIQQRRTFKYLGSIKMLLRYESFENVLEIPAVDSSNPLLLVKTSYRIAIYHLNHDTMRFRVILSYIVAVNELLIGYRQIPASSTSFNDYSITVLTRDGSYIHERDFSLSNEKVMADSAIRIMVSPLSTPAISPCYSVVESAN